MEQRKLVCPNCGAENEDTGFCAYCGKYIIGSIGSKWLYGINLPRGFNKSGYSVELTRKFSEDCNMEWSVFRETENENSIILTLIIPNEPYHIDNVTIDDKYVKYLSSSEYLHLEKKKGQIFKGKEYNYYSRKPSSLFLRVKAEKRADRSVRLMPKHISETDTHERFVTSNGAVYNVSCKAWVVTFEIEKDVLKLLIQHESILAIMAFDKANDIHTTSNNLGDISIPSITAKIELQKELSLLYSIAYEQEGIAKAINAIEDYKGQKETERKIEQQTQIKRKEQYKLRGKIYLVGLFVGLALIITGVTQLPFNFKYIGIGLLIDAVFFVLWLSWNDKKYKYQ